MIAMKLILNYSIMGKIFDIIAGAAAGDILCYCIFVCMAVIGYFVVTLVIKISGLPKLLMAALEASGEDDTYPEEGE